MPRQLESSPTAASARNAPLGSANLGLLVPLGEDGRKVGADDTTLVLDGLLGALLGDLLGDTLLVDAAVDDGPSDLARVLALKEEGFLLRGDEAVGGQRISRRAQSRVTERAKLERTGRASSRIGRRAFPVGVSSRCQRRCTDGRLSVSAPRRTLPG